MEKLAARAAAQSLSIQTWFTENLVQENPAMMHLITNEKTHQI